MIWKGVCRPASSTSCSPIKEDFGEVYFSTDFQKYAICDFQEELGIASLTSASISQSPQGQSEHWDYFSDSSLTSLFQMYLAMSRPESVSSVRGWQVERGAGPDKVGGKQTEQSLKT